MAYMPGAPTNQPAMDMLQPRPTPRVPNQGVSGAWAGQNRRQSRQPFGFADRRASAGGAASGGRGTGLQNMDSRRAFMQQLFGQQPGQFQARSRPMMGPRPGMGPSSGPMQQRLPGTATSPRPGGPGGGPGGAVDPRQRMMQMMRFRGRGPQRSPMQRMQGGGGQSPGYGAAVGNQGNMSALREQLFRRFGRGAPA